MGQAGDHPAVALVGEQPYVEAEPALLHRAGDAVEPARQPADHREQRRQLVRDRLLHGFRCHLAGHLVGRVCLRFGGDVHSRRQQGERAFQGAEGAQDGGDLGRDGQFEAGR